MKREIQEKVHLTYMSTVERDSDTVILRGGFITTDDDDKVHHLGEFAEMFDAKMTPPEFIEKLRSLADGLECWWDSNGEDTSTAHRCMARVVDEAVLRKVYREARKG